MLILALALWPAPAHAHLLETGLGPVYDGLAHFALSAEYVLPTVAMAVLAGLRGKNHARRVIVALPVAWLAGGVAGLGTGIVFSDALACGPLVALGGLVAADLPLPPAVTAGIAAALGGFLGVGDGQAMARAGLGLRGLGGSAASVFVVATLGAAAATAWQSGWLRIAWRVSGSWIAATGLLLLGWSLRR